MKATNPFGLAQWIQWMGATVAAAIAMMTFVYGSFESKEHAREMREPVEKRLDRIEGKLDTLISRQLDHSTGH